MAPTYLANAVAFLFILSRVLGFDIPYTPAEVENALTVVAVLATPLFSMFRQWWTGKSTWYGARI